MDLRRIYHEISTFKWQSCFKTVRGRGDDQIRYYPTSSAQEKPQEAEVIAVGPGGMVDRKEVTMRVKVGDRVIYSKYASNVVKLDGEEYIIVKQNDILAIVE